MKRRAPLPTRPAPPRRVAMLAFPGVQVLDAMGPLEVFSRTERWLRDQGLRKDRAYEVELLGLEAGPFPCSSGVGLVAARGYREVGRGLDTLMVAGGLGVRDCLEDRALLAWIRTQAAQVRRLVSICTGSFLLAEAGLLEGRRATTHWEHLAPFRENYPGTEVDPDALYVKDGAVYTSAGVTAGMDLALALVAEDFGRRVALEVARELVLFLHRPGGQAQFSAQLSTQLAEREPLRELQAWIADHPTADLSVAALAHRAAMSERHFTRVFTEEVGMGPGRYVDRIRLEVARRLLEEADRGLDQVASAAGLGTSESLRPAFLKAFGVPPGAYRARFFGA